MVSASRSIWLSLFYLFGAWTFEVLARRPGGACARTSLDGTGWVDFDDRLHAHKCQRRRTSLHPRSLRHPHGWPPETLVQVLRRPPTPPPPSHCLAPQDFGWITDPCPLLFRGLSQERLKTASLVAGLWRFITSGTLSEHLNKWLLANFRLTWKGSPLSLRL